LSLAGDRKTSTFAPPFGTNIPPIGGVMIYTFLSSVFITLFMVIGAIAFYLFLENSRKLLPFTWDCFQHVIVLAIIAAVCFILACVFGSLIPTCYVC
jgi:hypothetical protein